MAKPAPRLTPVNRPFWEACNEDRLRLQRCTAEACRRFVYFPRVCCPYCGNGDLTWEDVSGRGTVTTFTIVHQPLSPNFEADVPYVYGAVTLEEGPLLYTRLDVSPDAVQGLNGRSVEVVFRDDQVEGQKLPFFRPVELGA